MSINSLLKVSKKFSTCQLSVFLFPCLNKTGQFHLLYLLLGLLGIWTFPVDQYFLNVVLFVEYKMMSKFQNRANLNAFRYEEPTPHMYLYYVVV